MQVRKDEWLITVLFCAFLGIMSVLLLILPKEDFSQLEKRFLEKQPELTGKTLSSGDYGENIEKYMADHLPGRNFFIGLNAYVEYYTGRQVVKPIYMAKGDRLVESPVQWDQAQVDKNLRAIGKFAEKIGKNVDLMIVPSAGWAAENQIIGAHDPYYDDKIISDIYAQVPGDKVNCKDLSNIFENHPELYYRTDHHWTSEGAYKAYASYMESKGKEYPSVEMFTIETAEGFLGTTYSRSALWSTPAEKIEMWTCSKNLQVTIGESDEQHQGIFYKERLEDTDMYTVFLNGTQGVVRIDNPDNKAKGSILVIRDSYSCCFAPMLAESYETVVLLDMRWTDTPALELDAQYHFDDILICYSLSNFMSDSNFPELNLESRDK